MSDLQLRAEHIKLARLLGVDEGEVEFVHSLSVDECRVVRESISNALFDASRRSLERTAKAGKLLPIPILATIGEKVFGPMLCARVAGLFSADRAVAISKRLPYEFQADISMLMDPRSARELIGSMPLDSIVGVAKILAQREEFITAARFVDFLRDEVIAATIDALEPKAILQTGVYIENVQRLQEIIDLLSQAQITALVAAANDNNGALWPQILTVMELLREPQKQLLATASLEQGDAFFQDMLRGIHDADLWENAIGLYANLDEQTAVHFVKACIQLAQAAGDQFIQPLLESADIQELEELLNAISGQLSQDELTFLSGQQQKLTA